jgi:hypothetical protein
VARQDTLRRFTATAHVAKLRVMQKTIRLETNGEESLRAVLKFFERHQHGKFETPEFVWRLVCEYDPKAQSSVMQVSAFSDPGLRYASLGQKDFMAVDLSRREAMACLSDLSPEAKAGFKDRPPLDLLFSMTAAGLGLTTLCGGCVGADHRGVMIFGPPNSGKTTACYHAATDGMEFYSDQAVFLDMNNDALRAWGDFLPAVFRPAALEFLPELKQSAPRSTYGNLSFYCLDKHPLQARWAEPVIPVCSIFLNRGAANEPRLTQIAFEDAAVRLRGCMLFEEDSQFDTQIKEAINALAAKPAYILQYDSDPKTAAAFIRKMLL